MQVGSLGRPLRPPRWPSRRTKWRNLIRASALSAALIAVFVAGEVGVGYLRRPLSQADSTGPAAAAVAGSPAAPGAASEPAAQRGTEADSHTRTTDMAPSAFVFGSAEPKPKRLVAHLRSTAATHRQLVAARATQSNGTVHCALHGPGRESGCHQERARQPLGASLPPS